VSKLGFFHIAVKNHRATRFVVENVRLHHKTEPYILFSDAGEDFSYLNDEYSVITVSDEFRTGPPVGRYGYRLPKILEFFSRFKHACEISNAEYIVMLEDDVLVLNQITVPDGCEFMGHQQLGTIIDPTVADIIKHFSGNYDIVPIYACGGGSIFKTSIFLDNYEKIIDFYIDSTTQIQDFYPTWGWIDCFMHIYYLLAAAKYTTNSCMVDTHSHRPGFDYAGYLERLPDNIQIVNNFKKYYYE
jgi:hypothetical protein